VTFTDTSTAAAECPITTWAWSFGNGSSSLQNPTQLFTHSGNGSTSYSVVLTVINSEGSDTAQITVRVTD
jgi:PKD repeat protein